VRRLIVVVVMLLYRPSYERIKFGYPLENVRFLLYCRLI